MAKELGIQVKKEDDVNAWYTEIITKSNLIEYSPVSGCYILKPKSQHMWDTIREYMDKLLRSRGVRNAYFPLFIPENLLNKEKEHVEGFSPEVAWVTHAGDSKLQERLAVRPTSETIMYPAYAKWIRSHNDLPLLINQWCNIVRWEFKNPLPFLRSREFLWQEGHTVYATAEEAAKEVKDILLNVYKKTYEELLAIPCLVGQKSEKEKFAGADYTLSCEIFLPIGKAIQGCTTHFLGQNFSKPFGISFIDKDQKKQHPWQNSWGFTTRSLGIAVMMHSDSRGLVLPPRVAENKLIIIPIFRKGDNTKLVEASKKLAKELAAFDPILDIRETYSPGWKFNEAELNGIPLRIELGEKELQSKKATVARRDTLEKMQIPLADLKKRLPKLLDEIHSCILEKAKQLLEKSIVESYDLGELINIVKGGKIAKTIFDGRKETDEIIKDRTTGKTLNIPFDEKPKPGAVCPFSGNPAKHVVYIAKSL